MGWDGDGGGEVDVVRDYLLVMKIYKEEVGEWVNVRFIDKLLKGIWR